MNQDKIKEAFEKFCAEDVLQGKELQEFKRMPEGDRLKLGMRKAFLAGAEWIMSQSPSGDVMETLDPDLYTCPNCLHQSPARAVEIIEQAKLSGMKELAEKDALISDILQVLKNTPKTQGRIYIGDKPTWMPSGWYSPHEFGEIIRAELAKKDNL